MIAWDTLQHGVIIQLPRAWFEPGITKFAVHCFTIYDISPNYISCSFLDAKKLLGNSSYCYTNHRLYIRFEGLACMSANISLLFDRERKSFFFFFFLMWKKELMNWWKYSLPFLQYRLKDLHFYFIFKLSFFLFSSYSYLIPNFESSCLFYDEMKNWLFVNTADAWWKQVKFILSL